MLVIPVPRGSTSAPPPGAPSQRRPAPAQFPRPHLARAGGYTVARPGRRGVQGA